MKYDIKGNDAFAWESKIVESTINFATVCLQCAERLQSDDALERERESNQTHGFSKPF